MKKKIFSIFVLLLVVKFAFSQENIIGLRIKPYTDSVKIVPMLSYFVNVEAILADKMILPVSENDITVTTTYGEVKGMSLFFDNINKIAMPDSFMVSAYLNSNKNIIANKTLYIQKVNKDDATFQNVSMPIDVDSAAPAPMPQKVTKKKKRKKVF